jgi:tetratricopeptide (TPR) repeat protein
MSIYTAWLSVPSRGEYRFCTVSDDGSFLLVDGRMVCQWPGRHDAQGGVRAQRNGQVSLDAGLHKLEYYHANEGETSTAMAGWMPPGATQFFPIDNDNFAPILGSSTGPLEERGSPVVFDFKMTPVDWLRFDGQTFVTVEFERFADASLREGHQWQWRFDDGIVMSGDKIRRVFFSLGLHRLTMVFRGTDGKDRTSNRALSVSPRMESDLRDDGAIRADFRHVMDAMPMEMLQGDAASAAARFYEMSGDRDRALKTLRDAIEWQWNRSRRLDAQAIAEAAVYQAEAMGDAANAGAWLTGQLMRLGDSPAPWPLLLALGRTHLPQPGGDHADAARQSFESALAAMDKARVAANAPERREALILLGRAWQRAGDSVQARRAYERAESLVAPAAAGPPLTPASFALTAASLLAQDEIDEASATIDRWLAHFPTERLAGQALIFKARIAAVRDDIAGAVALLEDATSGGEPGVYQAEALELLGDLYTVERRMENARDAYRQILDAYNQPELRARVESKLRRVEGLAASR